MGRPTASLTGVLLLTAAWVADGVILKRRNPLSVCVPLMAPALLRNRSRRLA